MNRRDALKTALSSTALLATSSALAQGKPAPAPATPAGKPNLEALQAAADACTDAGEECFEHCVTMLSHGDTSMTECFANVRMMLPVCTALEALVRGNSPHLKAYAAACSKICRDCERACKK